MSPTTVRQIAIEVANEVIAEHDRYDTDEIDSEVADRLFAKIAEDGVLQTEVCLGAARSVRKAIERARQPRGQEQGEQISMFNPEAIVTLGEKQRVLMGSMVHNDLRAWRGVLVRNHEGQSKAFFKNMSYIESREQEWLKAKDRAKWSLMDLERQVFDY